MNKYFFICLTCLLALSCAKNDADEFARSWTGNSFVAYMQSPILSKTSLYDLTKVSWNEGDEVAVSPDGKSPVLFSAAASGASAELVSASGQVSGSSFLMAYPYDALRSVSDGKLDMSIPQRQTAAKYNFDPSSTVAVAHSDNLSEGVLFRNAHALLYLNIPQDLAGRAVKIEVETKAGEPLTGDFTVDPSTMRITAGTDVSDKVVLEASPAMEKGGYYLSVLPVSASQGIRAKVTMDDQSCYIRESWTLQFEADYIYTMGLAATKGWSYGTPMYKVETVVGSPIGTSNSVAGAGTAARLSFAQDLIKADDGSYWITTRSENAPSIWKMTPDYEISKLADVPSESYPWGGCCYQGDLYFVTKKTCCIYKCTDEGALTIVPFTYQDGTAVTWKNAMKVAFDAEGYMYVLYRHADVGENYIVKVDVAQGKVVKEWPIMVSVYDAFVFDRTQTKLFIFGRDDIQVLDTSSDSAVPVRIAGTGTYHSAPSDYTDGTPGNPLTATLNTCEGVVCDDDGVFYFGDIRAYTLRAFRPDLNGDYSKGTIETLCGSLYTAGSVDGTDNDAVLKYPGGIAMCEGGLYMVDGTSSGTIRKVTFGYDNKPCTESADREDYAGADDVISIF